MRQAARSGTRVKCVGAGHSFTPIAVTDGILLDLSRLTGIVAVTPTDTGAEVTVRAGTPLHRLNPLLWDLGLTMENLGDIDAQSVAGAIATGTHGTGAAFTGLAGQVVGLQIVLADGQVVDCSAQTEPELFAAARLGLGALGVITTLTLACVPAFALAAAEGPASLGAVLGDLDRTVAQTDHFEFYWWPHTDRVLTKHNTRLPGDTPLRPLPRWRRGLDDELLSNGVFELSNRLCTTLPQTTPRINAIAARLLSQRTFLDRSYAVYATPRRVRFREMEYAVPVDALPALLDGLDRLITDSGDPVSFPVEVRFAAADGVWLSTAHDRATAYVAIHRYWRQPYEHYFRGFEELAVGLGGRPHWGKMHWRTADDLRPEYPHFDDFRAVRDRVDPDRRFANAYLTAVLGD